MPSITRRPPAPAITEISEERISQLTLRALVIEIIRTSTRSTFPHRLVLLRIIFHLSVLRHLLPSAFRSFPRRRWRSVGHGGLSFIVGHVRGIFMRGREWKSLGCRIGLRRIFVFYSDPRNEQRMTSQDDQLAESVLDLEHLDTTTTYQITHILAAG